MFTGIITHLGTIARVQPVPGGREFHVALGTLAARTAPGDSIAVDGVCLTVSGLAGEVATFTAVQETLNRTTLGQRAAGDRVNLEAAARVGDAIGGHVVQGHVDGTGRVRSVEQRGADCIVTYEVSHELAMGLVAKGSVAIDGVSLTVVDARADAFTVALVPYTLENTTLGHRRAGAEVNIEVDILGKYVRKYVEAMR